MEGIVIDSRPIIKGKPGYIIFKVINNLHQYPLYNNLTVSFVANEPNVKYCIGWYDISTHVNHICTNRSIVNKKYLSCFECREKTGFNPAFYNTEMISNVQDKYNNSPHTVYVAYFGNGLAKAGIMSDSRGRERLYEQGALLYAIVKSYPNAIEARKTEEILISKGLRNSITKKQKEGALSKPLNIEQEYNNFNNILTKINSLARYNIHSCLNDYFFGSYIRDHITPYEKITLSGKIVGQVGRYLILENNYRYYGYWLTNLSGHSIKINNEVINIKSKPLQSALF